MNKGAGQSTAIVIAADDPHYSMREIVICMRVSATMLQMADADRPTLKKHNRGQAELLFAAAADLEAQQVT
jgi:hypothetical protein